MNIGRFSLVAAFLAAQWAAGLSAAERPNFLFIYTDDQRWDAMGAVQQEQGDRARFDWFQTPHLDRLAAEGVRFRNAFVISSLCAPSRAAFLTGRYNHHNGVVNNHTPFPVDAVTWPSLLRAAGYKTGYVGKWHMDGQSGKRPGFDYSASFVGQGRYFDCPFEIDGQATPTTGWVDDVSTDYAIDFVKEHRNDPFALIVGFKSAHGPFSPPERLAERYAGKQAKRVPNYDLPAVYQGKFDGGRSAAKGKKAGKKGGGAKKAKGAPRAAIDGPNKMRGYFGCLAAVDENVGRLLATLDQLELAENTVVVFASDNGFYLGEHKLGDKRSAYEESLRIPLLVRYPKLGAAAQGKLIDEIALNIDLAPTFLDLAGVEVPAEVQGASWRPLLEEKRVPWRQSFFYEYFYERNFSIPTTLAVRTARAKLIKYPGHEDWTELFDLRADPYETNNLAKDPAAKNLLAKMQAEFDEQAKQVGYVVPAFADSVPEQTP